MAFIDVYASSDMPSWPVGATPRWQNRITQSNDGSEQASQRWAHPLYRFTMPEVARTQAIFEAVNAHWMAMRGPRNSWPWRNPLDFASCEMFDPNEKDPPIAATDQRIGTGDGVTVDFQLVKNYTRYAKRYQRKIKLPVLGTVLIWIAGVVQLPSSYSVSRPGGIVTFNTAPGPGAVIRAGYLFDFEVRFESDDVFEGMRKSWAASGYAALTLLEKRDS